MIQERFLNPVKVEPYIHDRLSQGMTLSSLIARLSFTTGRVRTFLPPDIDDRTAYQLQYGGVMMHTAAPWPYLTMAIQQFLSRDVFTCCIFEHALADTTDPFIQEDTAPKVFFQDDVYFVVHGQDGSKDKIEEAIHSSKTYLLMGCMTSIPEGSDLLYPGKHLSQTEIQLLAQRTEAVIIGAYDGEGFLIWSQA